MAFEFFELVTVDQALARWRAALDRHVPATPPLSGLVELDQALDRVLAAPVMAHDDVPGFARSSVDGYAVRAADTHGASEAQPAYLQVTGEVAMGEEPRAALASAAAAKIATGGMLPAGADASVMLEYCEALPTGEIAVARPVSPGENVVRRGEDLRCGDEVLPAGHRLRPQDLGILAAAGVTGVAVHRVPRVAVVSTGDEVIPTRETPRPGQVRDVNGPALAAMVREAGGEPLPFGVVADERAALGDALRQAMGNADMLLVSGGSSVGARDYVSGALAELGAPGVLVHGVALRPGKPTLLAVAGRVPAIGLPGHPASALVVFWLFGKPAIRHLAGDLDRRGIVPSVQALLVRNVPSVAGREEYVRVALSPARDPAPQGTPPDDPANGAHDGRPAWSAEPVFGPSGVVRTLVRGDGLVRIPHGSEGLAAGTVVDVMLFGGISR